MHVLWKHESSGLDGSGTLKPKHCVPAEDEGASEEKSVQPHVFPFESDARRDSDALPSLSMHEHAKSSFTIGS